MTTRLAIVLMQKDEGELLRAWVDHHLSITSPELIHIFDNGSTCQQTRIILREAQQKGVRISLEFNRRSDFERKGDIICKSIQSIQADQSSDFIIPLDCDEFLGLQSDTDTEPTFDRISINNHLSQLKEQKGYFKIKRHYFNHPHEPDLYHINNTPRKYFFGSSALKSLDVGFHSPRLADESSQDQCLDSDLIAFHYHNKVFSIRRANAINKMRSRVNNFLDDDLRHYVGLGLHLLKDLRGIDAPFTPPKQYRTRAFLEHIQTSNISFPHNLFQETCFVDRWTGQRAGRHLRQELSKLRRSLQECTDRFEQTLPNSSIKTAIRLQTAAADIKQRYKTNYRSLQQLKQAIKDHPSSHKIGENKDTIVVTIRNHRSLANAYLATFISGRNQTIIFDCRNFWIDTDTQLLSLTSSAVQADEHRVILRHEDKCNAKLHKRLMLHFLMLALPQSGFKNKGK